MFGIDVGFYYFNKDFVHAKSSVFLCIDYVFTSHDYLSILDYFWLMSRLTTSKSMCNFLQFITFLHIVV
jgi:hypothetical protein